MGSHWRKIALTSAWSAWHWLCVKDKFKRFLYFKQHVRKLHKQSISYVSLLDLRCSKTCVYFFSNFARRKYVFLCFLLELIFNTLLLDIICPVYFKLFELRGKWFNVERLLSNTVTASFWRVWVSIQICSNQRISYGKLQEQRASQSSLQACAKEHSRHVNQTPCAIQCHTCTQKKMCGTTDCNKHPK